MKNRLSFSILILENSFSIFMNLGKYEKEDWQKLGGNFKKIISINENSNFQNELKRMSINYQHHKKEITPNQTTLKLGILSLFHL